MPAGFEPVYVTPAWMATDTLPAPAIPQPPLGRDLTAVAIATLRSVTDDDLILIQQRVPPLLANRLTDAVLAARHSPLPR